MRVETWDCTVSMVSAARLKLRNSYTRTKHRKSLR